MRLGYMAQISRTLGFDPGFNEAEAHAPRIQICHFVTILPSNASMRPRRMRLGYVLREDNWIDVVKASMRPRRMRLGYTASTQFCPRDHHASMRPRRMRLGYAGGGRISLK